MFQWRAIRAGDNTARAATLIRNKHAYNQRYEKFLMRWGSGLFWAYVLQCITGVLLGISYTPLFDTGMLAVLFLWWETCIGSTVIRVHSEIANLLFVILYLHMVTKLMTSLDGADLISMVSWLSGATILLLTYGAGVTGAIMPCSTLGEVTATIVGAALASLIYVKFDFLETAIVPGVSLNEESIWRTFILHAIIPIAGLGMGLIHMTTLHTHKYSAGGGFERLTAIPRLRETRKWSYANRYWSRASGMWVRIITAILAARLFNALYALKTQIVSYGLMNSEYWPIIENINFVLTIPHWYLRPLMGALVTIPHHYLGFIYIGMFFIMIFFAPWNYEAMLDMVWATQDTCPRDGVSTSRWSWLHMVIAFNFILGAAFTTTIIPTGKYFISLGSMDGLTYNYWSIVLYLAGISQLAMFIMRKLWVIVTL